MRGITLSNPLSPIAGPAGAAGLADCMAALGELASSTIVIVPSYAQQRFAVAAWASAYGAGRPPMVMPMATFIGHLADAVVDDGRSMIAEDEAQLLLDAVARRHGERPASIGFTVRTLHRFVNEGITAETLPQRPEFDDQDASVLYRLHNLHAIWCDYVAEINKRGYDRGGRLYRIMDSLMSGKHAAVYLRDTANPVTNLILRDVVSLPTAELKLLAVLAAQGWNVAIHWATEPAWRIEEGSGEHAQLRYSVHDVRLHDRSEEQNWQLQRLQWQHVDRRAPGSMPRAVLRACDSPAMEIRTILATVKTAVIRHGIPLARIAIVVPDLNRYEHAIRMMARSMGVPLTGGDRIDLLATGPAGAVLTACDVITAGWRRTDLDRLRRCAIGPQAAAAVHELVLAGQSRRITGGSGPSEWASALDDHYRVLSFRAQTADEGTASMIRIIEDAREALRECLPILHVEDGRMSAAEFVAAMERIIVGLKLDDVAASVQARAESMHRASAEAEAMQTLRDLLDRYGQIMTDPSMGMATFAEHVQALRPMLAAASVRLRDIRLEGVSLLKPIDARGRMFDLVLSPGWMEGALPSVPRYDTVEHDLMPYGRQHDELDMVIDVVRTVCSEHGRLIVTWPTKVGDSEMMPSQFCAMLDACTLMDAEDPLFAVDPKAGILSLDEYRMRNAIPATTTVSQDGYVLSQATPVSADAVRTHLERDLSPTRLTDYIDCPYAYAAARLLGVRTERSDDDALTALERGRMTHAIASEFFRTLRTRQHGEIDESDLAMALRHPVDLTCEPLESLQAILRDVAQRVIDAHSMGHTYRYAEARALLGTTTVAGLLQRWLAMEYAQALAGAPKPAAFEMAITETVTVGDEHVRVDLRIDRIDVEGEAPMSLVVIDYKNSSDSIPSSDDVRKGVKPQMPLYVLALDAACAARGIHAVARSAQYIPFGKKLLEAKSALRQAVLADESMPLGATSAVKGLDLDADLQTASDAMALTLQQLQQGSFPVRPRNSACDHCDYNELCRVQSLGTSA
jgi:RecB family exonuclease